MLLSATLSKPVKNISEKSGDEYQRIKLKLSSASSQEILYFAEFYTEKRFFIKNFRKKKLFLFWKKMQERLLKTAYSAPKLKKLQFLPAKKGK